jgi:hypothetical protein
MPDLVSLQPECYAFVTNVKGLDGAACREIGDGFLLRRPTEAELLDIKQILNKMHVPILKNIPSVWEWHFPVSGQARPLPPDEWRYFVIESANRNLAALRKMTMLLNLAPTEVDVGFIRFPIDPLPEEVAKIVQEAGGFLGGLDLNGRAPYFGGPPRYGTAFLDIGAQQAAEIAEIQALAAQSDRRFNLDRHLEQLLQLKRNPQHELRTLGYFALLESLVTHIPEPEDPYSSITRQLKKKLTLLNRRFNHPLDYSPFGNTPPETVWGKMYSYRSLIAHGGTPEFKGDLQLLQSPEVALKLVKDAVREVTTLALQEADLVLDLREC